MNKNDIKEIINEIKTPDNEEYVSYLLKRVDEISDEELKVILEKYNLTKDNLKQYLLDLFDKQKKEVKNSEKFIPVNDFFCYGRTGNTIHMHLIPEDLRPLKKELGDEEFYTYVKEQLEDFLAKMQNIFKEDETIQSLFAVSPIFYNSFISSIHESLGFDKIIEVDPNNKDDNMSLEQKEHFINIFNKGGKPKKVFYTNMTREKLLGMDYKEISEENYYKK